MMEIKYYRENDLSLADRAIDGLFGGLLGGALMGVALALMGLVIGETPLDFFARFGPGPAPAPAAGIMLHLAVSAVYGVGFSLLAALLPRQIKARLPGWLAGLGYGLLLMTLAVFILLPGVSSSLGELPLWALGLGHGVYGVVLGRWAYPKFNSLTNKQAL